MGGGRAVVGGTSNPYLVKIKPFYKPFLILGLLEGVGGAWGRPGDPNCSIPTLGGEYVLGYVLIEKKNSGAIFTPRNN